MVAGGQIQNLTQLFAGCHKFEVPVFQRNYSWEQTQVEDLFKDIVSTASGKDSHFLGGVILLKKGDGDYTVAEVVDGQQRLTTLFIMVSVIRDIANSLSLHEIPDVHHGAPISPRTDAQSLLYVREPQGSVPRFMPHQLVAPLVLKSVFAFPDDARPALPKRHKNTLKLRKAHATLNNLLSKSIAGFDDEQEKLLYLNKILDCIRFKLKVLVVESDDNSEAYEVFMTLNSRGLDLGPSDLVKSEMFKHLTRNLEGRNLDQKNSALAGDWQTLLANVELGSIDQFLRHYLVSKYEGSITSKKVFEKVSNLINRPGVDPVHESETLFKELLRVSGIYKALLNGVNPLEKPDAKKNPSLQLLREVGDSYRILALTIFDSQVTLDQADRLALLGLLETVVLRWVLTGQNAQDLENLMQTVSLAIRKGEPISSVKNLLLSKIEPDDKVLRTFEDEVDSATLVKAVLYRINRKWNVGGLVTYDTKGMHVEHIAPDTSTAHWAQKIVPDPDQENPGELYDSITELWGNKTILEWQINLDVKQKPFDLKCSGFDEVKPDGTTVRQNGYTNSVLGMTSDLIKLDDWDSNLIELRSRWIGECFLKIWSATPDPDSISTFSEWMSTRLAKDDGSVTV